MTIDAAPEALYERLAATFLERYGIAKDEADKQADEWAKALKEEQKAERHRSAGH